MKKKNAFGTILIAAGLIILAGAVSMKLWAAYKQKAMLDAFQTTIQTTETSVTDAGSSDQNTLGVLEIPKIDLTVAIGKDVTKETLKYSVGHFEGTALPGEKGNCSIAGHRSYTYSQFFNRLDEVSIGDIIKIKTSKGTFSYVVYDKFIVEPSHVEVLNPSADATLTLVTCTPIRVATHRLIVKARLQ
jgi:sortase A